MKKFIISIDSGTTSNRSIVFDLKGILNVCNDNYVYDVKVYNEDIYVASENGISIYNIK